MPILVSSMQEAAAHRNEHALTPCSASLSPPHISASFPLRMAVHPLLLRSHRSVAPIQRVLVSWMQMATRVLCLPISDLLGVQPEASDDEIKKAYRKRWVANATRHDSSSLSVPSNIIPTRVRQYRSCLSQIADSVGGDPELFKDLTHAYVSNGVCFAQYADSLATKSSRTPTSDPSMTKLAKLVSKAVVEWVAVWTHRTFSASCSEAVVASSEAEVSFIRISGSRADPSRRWQKPRAPTRKGSCSPYWRLPRRPVQRQSPEARAIEIGHLQRL